MRDFSSNIHLKPAFLPGAAVADNTAQVSQILDTNGYAGAALAFVTGTLSDADATFTVLIEESDASDMSGAVAVDDSVLIGTEALASFSYADDGECRKIGYVGFKRYVRATITPSGNAGNLFVAGMWVVKPQSRPAPNPPQ